jgi:molecular chaperone HscB
MNERNGQARPDADGPATCWSCRGPVDVRALFCHTCGMVQANRPVDHFVRLGMRRAYDLDMAELERQYFGFQRRFHPDRFAAKSATEKAHSLQHAASLNEAYEALKSPVRRASYLLELFGRPVIEEDQTISDPALLMEALEMREALAEAQDSAAVAAVAADAETKIGDCQTALSAAFATDDLETATELTLRLTYLDKILRECKSQAQSPGTA